MNYQDLTKLARPPNFNLLAYKTPPDAVDEFLKKSNGSTSLELPGIGGSVSTFKLEDEDWVFISVFLVPDSKVPIQGAYILKSEFEGSSRDLRRSSRPACFFCSLLISLAEFIFTRKGR